MATATRIGIDIGGYAGVAHHYRLDEPLDGNEFVVVFAVDMPGTMHDETVIVGAREDGSAHLMNRLPGSLVGWADHEKALQLAGYSLGEDDIAAPVLQEPEEQVQENVVETDTQETVDETDQQS